MLEHLSCACDRCDDALTDDRLILSMTTEFGTQRAYECRCGAVTITVVDDAAASADSDADTPSR